MQIVDEIARAWGWAGIEPTEVIAENDFGNFIVKDVAAKYWRLRPEDLSCKVVAQTHGALNRLFEDQEFLRDWHMGSLVQYARQNCGPLEVGRKYCLKIPGVLGGEYGGDNITTISLIELIRASGDLAQQVKDLPDRTHVKLRVTE